MSYPAEARGIRAGAGRGLDFGSGSVAALPGDGGRRPFGATKGRRAGVHSGEYLVYQYEEPKSVVLRLAGSLEVSFTEAEWEILREETGARAARILNSMIPEGEEFRYRAQ